MLKPGTRAAIGALALAMAATTLPVTHADAQNRVRIIRDAEIEALLQDYAAPIFKAAGIRSSSVEILIIPDRRFNAFVADGQRMFINTGAILRADTPNQLIGVIAHETGHLAGDHLSQLRQVIKSSQVATILAAALGIGAAVAGAAATGDNSLLGAAGAAIAGSGEIARRNILSYARSEEIAADRSAMTYLEQTGQSGEGMLETFRRFQNDSLFSSRTADPYQQSHPMPRERIANIERLVASSKFRTRKDPAELQLRHDLVRAKLSAFTEDPASIGRRFPANDNSLPARYARAVIAGRFSNVDRASQQIDALIRERPNYAYFWELKGQFLLEAGRAGQALEPLRKAVSLDSRSGLLRILYGHALVETGDKRHTDEAIKQLSMGVQLTPNVAMGHRQLARAYAAKGDVARAQLATAEGLFAEGDIREAKQQASRAQAKLTPNSPPWRRANDILAYDPPRLR